MPIWALIKLMVVSLDHDNMYITVYMQTLKHKLIISLRRTLTYLGNICLDIHLGLSTYYRYDMKNEHVFSFFVLNSLISISYIVN